MSNNKKDSLQFPFSAILGHKELKQALILNIIDPKIGGVLAMGDRGTGKSTIVRSLASLLPPIKVIKGDFFNSHPTDIRLMGEEAVAKNSANLLKESDFEEITLPLVDLPLGATEDRVCGAIDMEKALTTGSKSFEPGLLAKANRGILYVDEVNLLDDHLVDILLDSAASGINTVEREGISIRHPANFILIGSGNPEEGELRPQLLDRFGMFVEVRTLKEPEERVRVVEERVAFDLEPEKWTQKYKESDDSLKCAIIKAKEILPQVTISYELKKKISEVCSLLDIDGLRGDLVVNRAAKSLAAFSGRRQVVEEDITNVISVCLRHRLRKDPLENIDSGAKVLATLSDLL